MATRGDVGALLPMLQQKRNTSWREEIENNVREWWKTLHDRAMAAANPVNPQRITWELSPRLPDHAIITCDSGPAPTGMRAI